MLMKIWYSYYVLLEYKNTVTQNSHQNKKEKVKG